MTRPPRHRHRWKNSLVASLVLHGGALLLVVVLPLLAKGCAARKPPQKLMFVEFTVAVPPSAPEPAPPEPEPPAPTPPAPIPEPPPPPPKENIPEPEKKSDPKPEPPKPAPEKPKPKRHTVIPQTNRVVRGPTPQPKGPVLSDKEIEDLIKKGAKIGDATVIPADASSQALGAYSNHVRDRLYAAWQQPESLKNLPGLVTVVQITIQQDGRVGNGKILQSSGSTIMDESVLKAIRTVKAMRALPTGVKGPVELPIAFELAD